MTRNYFWLVGLMLVAFFATSMRLWQFDYPPLNDWPNHLARHAIQCNSPVFGQLGAYYTFALKPVPNLTSDLIHAFRPACFDIFLTQKILIQFAIFGLILSAFALHFAIWRRFSVWPGLAALVTLNLNLGYGFENYVLAMPLSLGLLALWIALDRANTWLRTAIVAPLGVLLYFSHIYAFIFFGVMIAAIELRRALVLWREGVPHRAAIVSRLVSGVIVGLIPVLHIATTIGAGASPSMGDIAYGGLTSRFIALTSVSSPQFFYALDSLERLETIATIVLLSLMPLLIRLVGGRVSFDRRFSWAVIGCLLLFFAIPSTLAPVYFSEIRFPVLIVILLIAATDIRLGRAKEIGLAVFLVLAFGLRIGLSEPRWALHEQQVKELIAATEMFGPNDRLVLAREGIDEQLLRHSYTLVYASMQNGFVAPLLFYGLNPLTPNPEIADFARMTSFPVDAADLVRDIAAGGALSNGRSFDGWAQFYTHVLVIKSESESISRFDGLGSLVKSGSFFDIYALPTTVSPD